MKTSVQHNANNIDAFRRPPEVVMRLARMGSFHQTRLSFMRTLLRRLKKENWRFKRGVWEIDDQGFGRAVYTVYFRRELGPGQGRSPHYGHATHFSRR